MNLIIEVTRKCNLECDHCLRGCAENLNIKNEYITKMLEQIKALGLCHDVTFTGGEPTLNLNAVKHYIKECERLNISHSYFYIATNGFKLDLDFAGVCLQLYAMADEHEMCAVELSNDQQHEYKSDSDKAIMRGLAFFRDKHEKSINYFDRNSGVILEGNAKNHTSDGRELTVYDFGDFEDWEDHQIYLNAKGNLINGCDWSFDTQDNNNDVFICHVNDFSNWYMQNVRTVSEVA